MGLWDYDAEVEACEPSTSSSSSGSDSDRPSTKKKGRKRKALYRPAFDTPGSIGNDDQLPTINLTNQPDSDSDDDIIVASENKPNAAPGSSSRKKARPSSAGKRSGKGPVGLTPDDRPESYLDKDTLQQLKQNDLRKLLEDDDLDEPQPGTSTIPTTSTHHAYDHVPHERLTEEDLRVLESVRQNTLPPEAAATSAGHAAGPASKEGGTDEDGAKICISVQGKDGKIKIKISPHNAFRKLLEKFKEHALQQGWLQNGQDVRLMLDGDVLSPEDTPAEQGLEDDDVVEARY